MSDRSSAITFYQDEKPLLLTPLFRLPLINIINQLDLPSICRTMLSCRTLHDFCAHSGAISIPIKADLVTWTGRIAVFHWNRLILCEFDVENVPVRILAKRMDLFGGFATPELFENFVAKLRRLKIKSVEEFRSAGGMLSGNHLEKLIKMFNIRKVLIDRPPLPEILFGPTLQSLHHLDIHGMSPADAKDYLLMTRIPEVRLSSRTLVPRHVFRKIIEQWRHGQREIEKMRFLTVASPSALLRGLSAPYRVSHRKASILEKRADGKSLYCFLYNWHRDYCYVRLSRTRSHSRNDVDIGFGVDIV